MKQAAHPKRLRPERALAGSFLALIALGTALLALPAASATGEPVGLFNALFTATSAVCVTGLIVVDTGTAFSLFGHVVLLVLIQLGGLGLMLFATLIMAAMGRRITLRDRVLIRESISAPTMTGLTRLALWNGLMALCIELAGAAVLAIRFVPAYGWGKGLFFSLFHGVSAFCNAGFDLMGGYASLTAWQHDPLVLLPIAALIILGGLGFPVLVEIISRRGRFSLHTRLVLRATAVLLAAGTTFYALAEWHNPRTLATEDASIGTRLLGAFFQSVTMRTAGFNSVDLAALTDASKLFSVVLMFIGASPASTGGGVKTTTMSVLLLIVLSVIRGQEQVNAYGRRLPIGLMRRALAILCISLAVMLAGTVGLALLEKQRPLIDLLFESASAMATVGVTSTGTPGLSLGSKLLLIPMMFFGRVGPLTMALALAGRMKRGENRLKYPEGRIMIG